MTDTSPVAAKPQTLVWSDPWHNLAFGFGSGLMPKAPGTWGSLVALPFVPLWQLLPGWGYLLMLGLTMLFGVWLCGKVARELGVELGRKSARVTHLNAGSTLADGSCALLQGGA